MITENNLKKLMDREIKAIINRYNASVFVLNGGSTVKALHEFKYNVGGKSIRCWCRESNPEAYKNIKEVDLNKLWFDDFSNEWHYDEPSLNQLRENKHLFIGEKEE